MSSRGLSPSRIGFLSYRFFRSLSVFCGVEDNARSSAFEGKQCMSVSLSYVARNRDSQNVPDEVLLTGRALLDRVLTSQTFRRRAKYKAGTDTFPAL